MAGMKLTKKQWSELSEESRELATTLGLAPTIVKTKGKKEEYKFKLTPYILGVRSTCSLCGSVATTIWSMEDKDGELLKSRMLPPGTKTDKVMEMTTPRCYQCRDKLMDLAKEELVEMLLNIKKRR